MRVEEMSPEELARYLISAIKEKLSLGDDPFRQVRALLTTWRDGWSDAENKEGVL